MNNWFMAIVTANRKGPSQCMGGTVTHKALTSTKQTEIHDWHTLPVNASVDPLYQILAAMGD